MTPSETMNMGRRMNLLVALALGGIALCRYSAYATSTEGLTQSNACVRAFIGLADDVCGLKASHRELAFLTSSNYSCSVSGVSNLDIRAHLKYEHNVEQIRYSQRMQQMYGTVVLNNGIRLDIHVSNKILVPPDGEQYDLSDVVPKLRLFYYLEAKPHNTALDEAIRGIIHKRIEELRRNAGTSQQ